MQGQLDSILFVYIALDYLDIIITVITVFSEGSSFKSTIVPNGKEKDQRT